MIYKNEAEDKKRKKKGKEKKEEKSKEKEIKEEKLEHSPPPTSTGLLLKHILETHHTFQKRLKTTTTNHSQHVKVHNVENTKQAYTFMFRIHFICVGM